MEQKDQTETLRPSSNQGFFRYQPTAIHIGFIVSDLKLSNTKSILEICNVCISKRFGQISGCFHQGLAKTD